MTTRPHHDAGRIDAPTEQRHPDTTDLDQLSTMELLEVINAEDATVAPAVRAALPALAAAVDHAVRALRSGRSVHYFGAGTSGRIASLDAAELAPTFGLEPGRVMAHHAGGSDALDTPHEYAEDDGDHGAAEAAALGEGDVAVGLSASGRTPYVAGALRAARQAGAVTVLVSCNPGSLIAADTDVHVCVDTGPEVLTGSTRMKAGTAQKLALNAFSTAVMVSLGRTYSNLMVSVVGKNEKLRARTVTILAEASGHERAACTEALAEAGGELKVALVSLLGEVDAHHARSVLSRADGQVRAALQGLNGAGAVDNTATP